MTYPRVFLSPPHMGGAEFEFVREAFATDWIAPIGVHVDASGGPTENAPGMGRIVDRGGDAHWIRMSQPGVLLGVARTVKPHENTDI